MISANTGMPTANKVVKSADPLWVCTQRNKEAEWNTQPLRSPLLFQNKSQKPGQKALKR